MRSEGITVASCAAALSALVATPALSQQGERPWKAAARIEGEIRYDDNLFLLTNGQKRTLSQPSAAEVRSRRFTDMGSATDAIPVPSGEVELSGPGAFGRTLTIRTAGAYEANVQNDRRRHAELDFAIEQALSTAGRVRLSADWRPSYFHKNYLDAVRDLNGDGNITPDERVYEAGVSRDLAFSAGYRRRFVKATGRRPLGLTGALEVGYAAERYDARFLDRTRRGPQAGTRLALELGRRWTVETSYSYGRMRAAPTRVVMILDETAFGRDFNGNGTFTDSAARAFELVDRSRHERELGLSVAGGLSHGVTAELTYARRNRDYTSTEPYDIADRGRYDTRNELGLDLALRLTSGMRLTVGGVLVQQSTNRGGDPAATGEVADYSRRVALAGLQYRF